MEKPTHPVTSVLCSMRAKTKERQVVHVVLDRANKFPGFLTSENNNLRHAPVLISLRLGLRHMIFVSIVGLQHYSQWSEITFIPVFILLVVHHEHEEAIIGGFITFEDRIWFKLF